MRGSKPVHKNQVFKNLSDLDIIKLLNVKTQKEIAELFGISGTYISLEITRRNLFEVMNNDKKRKCVPYFLKQEMFSDNEDDYGLNAWMESNGRISINQTKLIVGVE